MVFDELFEDNSVDGDDERNILPILICGDSRNFIGASSLEFLCDIDITFCVLVVDNNEHFSLLRPEKTVACRIERTIGHL